MIDLFIGCPRVSSDAQAEDGTSLQTQEDALRAYGKRIGAKRIIICADDISGRTPIRERPGGKELYRHIDAGTANLAVGWYRISRVSRDDDLVELPLIMRDLRRIGAEFHVCDRGRVDLDDHFAKAILILEGASAAKDNRDRAEATKRGKDRKAAQGLIVGAGKPPYGFARVGERNKTEYVIDAGQAEAIKKVYQWLVIEGKPLHWCSTALDALGVPPPSASARGWYSTTLYRILKSKALTGRFKHGEYEIRREDLRILTDEQFDQIRAQLRRNLEMSPRRTTREYLVSGRIRCSCGRMMVGRPNMLGSWYYVCPPRKYSGTKCPQSHVRANTDRGIDGLVWAKVVEFCTDTALLRQSIEMINRRKLAASAPSADRLTQAKRQLGKARLKVERLSEALGNARGGAVAVLQEQLSKAANDQASAQNAVDVIERTAAQSAKLINVPDTIRTMRTIGKRLAGPLSFALKREVLRVLDVECQLLDCGSMFTRRMDIRFAAIMGDDAVMTVEGI